MHGRRASSQRKSFAHQDEKGGPERILGSLSVVQHPTANTEDHRTEQCAVAMAAPMVTLSKSAQGHRLKNTS
jgi:hypothetical protein